MQTTPPPINRLHTRTAILNSSLVPVAIVAIGAILRLESVWFSFCIDDWDALHQSLRVFPTLLHRFRPVFFTVLHFWRMLGPDTDWWIKLMPFGYSLAAVPLAWFVGKRFGGRPVAAALSLLVALSPLHLDITAELRMYGLMSALGLAQMLCYLRLRETGRTGFLVGSTIIGTVGMYSQPIYSLYLFGLLVFAFLDRRHVPFWRFVVALVGIAALYAPWVVVTMSYGKTVLRSPLAFTTHPLSAPFKLLAAYATGFSYFRVQDLGLGAKFGLREVMNNLPLVLLAVAAFSLIAVGAVRQLREPGERLARYAVIALVVLPFTIAYCGVLIVHRNFTHANFHITSLPFVLLFLIKGIQGLGRIRILQAAAVVVYAVVISISLFHFYFDTQHYGRRSDWHQATRFIEQHVTPDKPLLIFASTPAKPIDYPYLNYYARHTQSSWRPISIPRHFQGTEEYAAYLQEHLAGYAEVYYLWDATLKDMIDPRNMVLESLRSIGTDESVDVISPRLALYQWTLRK